MVEEHPRRSPFETGSGAIPRRLAALLSRDPRLPRPPRAPRLDAIRRSWLAAFWHARISIRAGVPLDDFLRSRHARYLAGLPHARLPLAVEIDDGQIAVRPVTPEPAEAPPAREPETHDAWLTPLIAVEGPAVRQEAAELEIRLVALDGELEVARQRTDALSRKLAADVAAGAVAAPASVDATAEQLGRPALRSTTPHAAMLAFAAASILAETWQVTLPLLRVAGVDPSALPVAVSRRPADVLLAAVFGLGVCAGLFGLAHVGLDARVQAYRGDPDLRRRNWLVTGGSVAFAAAAVVASAVASLPSAAAGGMAPWTFVALLLVVPVATSLVLRAARRDRESRAAEVAAALAWDRERAKTLADRARRAEEVSIAEAQERDLEQRRDAARRRLREIHARAMQADRLQKDAAHRERAALARVAQSLVAALELDRYEFVRQAAARGATALVAPRRRPAPAEARPPPSPGPTPPEPTRVAV